MKNPIKTLIALLAASATVTATYAVCFSSFYSQQCVTPGQCYSACTPQGCSQSTCILAGDYGYETGQYNVNVSLSGTYGSRSWDGFSYNTCFVNSCTLYNNCTQRYEQPPPSCSCNFQVKQYQVVQPGCP